MFRFSVEIDNTDEDPAYEVDVQLEVYGVTVFGDDDDFELDFKDVPKLIGSAFKFVTDLFQSDEE